MASCRRSPARSRGAAKAADGRRFSVVLRGGRVVEQHLGGITRAF
jgi:hypothetical protein